MSGTQQQSQQQNAPSMLREIQNSLDYLKSNNKNIEFQLEKLVKSMETLATSVANMSQNATVVNSHLTKDKKPKGKTGPNIMAFWNANMKNGPMSFSKDHSDVLFANKTVPQSHAYGSKVSANILALATTKKASSSTFGSKKDEERASLVYKQAWNIMIEQSKQKNIVVKNANGTETTTVNPVSQEADRMIEQVKADFTAFKAQYPYGSESDKKTTDKTSQPSVENGDSHVVPFSNDEISGFFSASS